MVSVRGEKWQRPSRHTCRVRRDGLALVHSQWSKPRYRYAVVVEMSRGRGRAREVGAAGGRGGLCAGGEGCRELGRVLLFRTVDGGGVGRMHFLD